MDFEPYEESGKPRAALINARDSFRCSLRLGLTLVWVRVRVRAGFGARVKVKEQTQRQSLAEHLVDVDFG